ncbi:MAG: tRNA (adenosine(37)-N6)-threonylcarbamoyltransferase complex dimerization subunit type 1 TsaB [Nitrosomonas sp.]|nr:MAG: tRNA (adenosine(37)-N6)-threonylcarbamoyltransferase complex dimerization subunit type 1 TsaB [Nitrosomonas sp.]
MIILLIDTCTERGVVALFRDTELLFKEELPLGLQNSAVLLPTVAKGLDTAGLDASQLGLVVVGAGPGSYTGIRVGVAAAKAIAFAHQIPLIGVSTLNGLISDKEEPYAALIDAKIGGVYYQIGRRVNGQIEYFNEPALATVEDLVSKMQGIKTVITPVAAALKRRLDTVISSCEWIENAPDTTQMVRVALERYVNGQYSLNGEVSILYLRKTQAEIEKEGNC